MPHEAARPRTRNAAPASERGASSAVRTFYRKGCTIHWWASGPRDGPCVVLTHGVTLDHGTYASQVPVLAKAGIRVLTWDLRGHGLSRPAAEPITLERAADDLHALLGAAGATRAVLVGQSFGGLIVQACQRRHPDRVAGVVLAGSLPLGVRVLWPFSLVYGKVAPAMQRVWPEGHLRRMVPPFMSKRDDVRRYVADAIRPLGREDFATFTKAAAAALGYRDRSERLDVPTLCVIGDAEIPFVARATRTWAERRPLAQVATIERAGHLVNQENPEAFCETVVGFVRDLEAMAAPRG
jgi:3-oxoadipate enol-lactonase